MTLLGELPLPGYPDDYLLARIRGRRAHLVADWPTLVTGAPPPQAAAEMRWQGLQREAVWLYRQMDRKLRRSLAPVLTMFEIRTLCLCLRHAEGRDRQRIDELLRFSLLGKRLKAALRRGAGLSAAVTELACLLAGIAPEFRGLEEAYRDKGLRGFEAALARSTLEHLLSRRPAPPVGRFLGRLVDLRNVLALYKHLHWGLEAPPSFIAGGNIPLGELQKAWQRKDPAALPPLIGEEGATAPVEIALLRSLTRALRRESRELSDVALVLDYLWRRYLEARNLRLLAVGRELPAERLAAEMIR